LGCSDVEEEFGVDSPTDGADDVRAWVTFVDALFHALQSCFTPRGGDLIELVDHDKRRGAVAGRRRRCSIDGVEMPQGVHYVDDPAARSVPYASPLRAEDLSNLPPAIVIAAVAKPLKPSIVAIRCFTPR